MIFGTFTIENCDAAKSQILLAPKIPSKSSILGPQKPKVFVGYEFLSG